MQKKQSWYSQYTLEYPNRDPDKISAYAVGWTSIALLGACVMFADIPAGVLLIVLLGLILTGVMLWKNPERFKIKSVRKIPWILAAFALPYLSTLIFACLYWRTGERLSVIMCIISALRNGYDEAGTGSQHDDVQFLHDILYPFLYGYRIRYINSIPVPG